MNSSSGGQLGSGGGRYDLAVCYRIYPRVSGQPIFGFREKLALVRLNLESFNEAVGQLKVKMWVLLDNCPPSYRELVASLFPETSVEFVSLGGEGNEATFARQIDILAAQQAAELVYFAEDDYLYLPGALERAVDFLRRHPEADAVNVADHAAYHERYVDRIRSPQHVEDGCQWRTVVATALTFMIRRQTLIETAGVFKTYSRKNSDLGFVDGFDQISGIQPVVIRSRFWGWSIHSRIDRPGLASRLASNSFWQAADALGSLAISGDSHANHRPGTGCGVGACFRRSRAGLRQQSTAL